ncbi:DNA-binding response regulator [Marinococcus halophilus]|uniref:Putative transcriptional regulatory protein YkoG n=1 Tax=Marinococcus halophilus TaxID=1371 RepID=A0A510Y9Q1_MARHA|nr:response regulator transcription factor [Marinococcus halophilus]OZT78927.1 DNA-binding response regulator [Marinococcus halophilus]GEK60095.1 putative transcriptional regulatory protein YkoG [Marinococcus halophilus]
MEQARILIVEDEEKIARVLELELTYENYYVQKATDGLKGFAMYQEKTWDLIILDIMLPGISGIELLRRIRSQDKKTAVLLVTAKDSVEDKVSGLDLGANDYITKPFQIEELLARVRSSLRFQTETALKAEAEEEEHWLSAGELRLNESAREVYAGTEPVELTRREFDLLYYLLRNKKQVLSRDQILEQVWGFDYIGETNVVDVYIRYLRNKIDKPFGTTHIQTVRGVGYVVKDSP